jgi:hypothetical protein
VGAGGVFAVFAAFFLVLCVSEWIVGLWHSRPSRKQNEQTQECFVSRMINWNLIVGCQAKRQTTRLLGICTPPLIIDFELFARNFEEKWVSQTAEAI